VHECFDKEYKIFQAANPEIEFMSEFDENVFTLNSIVVLDDLQLKLQGDLNQRICDLVTIGFNNRLISVIICIHSIFCKPLRLVFLNSEYLLLFAFN
jgi:hypothetical protein